MRSLALLPLPLMLVACGAPDGNTSLAINIQDEQGNTAIATDASGTAKIKAGGFEASVKLPKLNIDADDFDADGIKLYPGTTIGNFDLNARDHVEGKDKGRVAISFASPASLDEAQAWFRDQAAKAGAKVQPQGSGFAGTTKDGEPLTIALEADGADKVKGRMEIGDRP